MIGYAIDVNTRELTRVLKRLKKTEKTAPRVYLRYVPGKLTISLGETSDELPATSSWQSLVSTSAKWVATLADTPISAATTDLRVHDGKLWARDFGLACIVHEEKPSKIAAIGRRVKRAGL